MASFYIAEKPCDKVFHRACPGVCGVFRGVPGFRKLRFAWSKTGKLLKCLNNKNQFYIFTNEGFLQADWLSVQVKADAPPSYGLVCYGKP